MKKLALIIASMAALNATANELSPQNPVMQPLTVKDSEAVLSAGVALEFDGDNEAGIGLNARYGITDNVTLGLGGIQYRFLQRNDDSLGLELAVNAGLRGHRETGDNDAFAWGTGIVGKYVMSEDTALTFNADYIWWDEENRDNRREYVVGVGVMQNVFDSVTLTANYSYHFLDGFFDDNAQTAEVGAIYTFNQQWAINTFAGYSDFDASNNGYDEDASFETYVGAGVTYRF